MNVFSLKSEAQALPCRRTLFAFSAIFIVVFAIYSNTFNASWHFDDQESILERKELHLKKISWPEIKKTFFRGKTIYRPVACLSLALNYYFGGTDVFGYHLVNTFIHILAALFLFLFIYQTLNLPSLKPIYGSNAYLIALLTSFFWAVNPVQTQAVTYIVQRMASMAGMFYIMAMYFYLKGRTAERRSLGIMHYFMCFTSSMLAFATKENTATLPFSILLLDFFLIQGLTRRNIKKNTYIFLILLIIPPVLALILRGPSVFESEKILSLYEKKRVFTLAERLLTEPRVILFYISLLLYPMPHRLSITHDMAISHSFIDPPTTIIAILVILGILGLCIMRSARWPFITYCVIFFFLNHVIEGSIFGLELIFEHRNYLPSMLLFAPLAVLFVKGLDFFSARRAMQAVLSLFVILVLVGFGHSTYTRNFVWKTGGTLWANAANKAPELTRPRINLGFYYISNNMLEEALSEFTAAASGRIIHKTADRGISLYNIGFVHQKMGNLDQALKYYKESEKALKNNADTHNNMGVIYLQKGLDEKALQKFQQTIQYDKNHTKALRNVGLLLVKEGQPGEALEYLNRALKVSDNDAKVLATAGYAHRIIGSYGNAFLCFEKAVSIEPHDPKVHLYLSEIYFKRGMHKQAEKQINEFIIREKDVDLQGYAIGYAKEENSYGIKPYKRLVLKRLAKAYEDKAHHVEEKVRYLNEQISEME